MVRDTSPSATAPFSGTPEPASFFRGPAQEESLARLEWLAVERQRCGLVVGASGLGKSHLVAMAARRLAGLAAGTGHLSTETFPAELAKLGRDVRWIVVHRKARYAAEIAAELAELGLPRVELVRPGAVYEF